MPTDPEKAGWYECELATDEKLEYAHETVDTPGAGKVVHLHRLSTLREVEELSFWLALWFNPHSETRWWLGVPGRCRPLVDLFPKHTILRWKRPPPIRLRKVIQSYDAPEPPDLPPMTDEERAADEAEWEALENE